MAVKGLDSLKQLFARAPGIVREEMRRAAVELAKLQGEYIEQGRSPEGGAQKANSPRYKARKGNKPALYRTGRLSTWSLWRITPEGKGWRLSPPSDRVEVVRRLRDRGFEFVKDQIPADFVRKVQRRVIQRIEEKK